MRPGRAHTPSARSLARWGWLILAGCTAPGGPGSEPVDLPSAHDAGTDVSVAAAAVCLAPSAEALPARMISTGDPGTTTTTTTQQRTVFVNDLFLHFRGNCGGCHVDNSIGNFHVVRATFPDLDRKKVEEVVTSDDPAKVMPPPPVGKPFSQRMSDYRGGDDPVVLHASDDQVVQMLKELRAWDDAGRPLDVFKIAVDSAGASDSYALPEMLAARQTNMGNCIPSAGLVGTQADVMDELDTMFAGATELPQKLSATDLTTFDSEALARRGVISFAPAYPLWSEDSGKMRAIRVPRGKSVKFDKATQSFSIPPNTRFYKTFLKKITAADGTTVWRKIETRVIVARPDVEHTDGTPAEVQAIFGTYAWNDDETDAVLVTDKLRNGESFADRLFTYVADEPRYDALLAMHPENLNYELGLEKNKGIVRHYAIPGRQRCVECHMGSANKDFVLGFLPVQIRRRPMGVAGVYEDVRPDELNQLQRLIDYKVITGVSSPSDIRGLEEPQGAPDKLRPYRNQYELTAQAYLLGNCSHCHNPRGFPSVKSPELVDMLDFLPSQRPSGGVFRFPLDRTSPLRRRGAAQDVEIPYLTPSLRDYPVDGSSVNGLWTRKWVDCLTGIWAGAFCDLFTPDNVQFVPAPWRALVYRNVDTPYIYADDFTVFPHMPRHSVGFDCRAPRFLGQWMVSIPAVHKDEGAAYEDSVRQPPFDTSAQPYREVVPGDPDYQAGVEGATTRLHEYLTGKRYAYCPDRSDIVVPEALTTDDPKKLTPPDVVQYVNADRKAVTMPQDGVPDRAHFVPSDLTEVPGDWVPRRNDWESFLRDPKPAANSDNEADVPTVLRDLHITADMRRYATQEIPFGLWKAKAGCDFSGVKRARDFSGSDRGLWMDNPSSGVASDSPVYTITPGGAVFSNICVNCHGPQADSKGVLAEAISEMTGGAARVANFRDGLLGPVGHEGDNLTRVFGDEEWTARYLSWMALGGTQRLIPQSLLKIAGATLVLGKSRDQRHVGLPETPNMLELARGLCRSVLGPDNGTDLVDFFDPNRKPMFQWSLYGLLDNTGDAEMWLRLCTVGNRPVVRVPRFESGRWKLKFESSYFWGETYGQNPVLNDRGLVDSDGIRGDNLMPICLPADDLAQNPDAAKSPLISADGKPYPTCPPALLETAAGSDGQPAFTHGLRAVHVGGPLTLVGRDNEWAVRGAANAGVSVLLYLEAVRKGQLQPKVPFDHCERLPKAMTTMTAGGSP